MTYLTDMLCVSLETAELQVSCIQASPHKFLILVTTTKFHREDKADFIGHLFFSEELLNKLFEGKFDQYKIQF